MRRQEGPQSIASSCVENESFTKPNKDYGILIDHSYYNTLNFPEKS
jgi:hypothetical protein